MLDEKTIPAMAAAAGSQFGESLAIAVADTRLTHAELIDQARRFGAALVAAGSESRVEKRLQAFVDAGATDVSVRVVPIGEDREARLASMKRTREFLASL